jgi:NADPH:quinone reductase-like Zn-dependent oxidoreductase
MRAAVVEAAGSPPRPAEADDPAREDGTAFVAVAAAALNPVEIRVASGRHPREAQPPHIPGLEGERAAVPEGRLVNMGQAAGSDVRLPLEIVRNRQGAIHAISSGWTDLAQKAAAYGRVLAHALAGRLTVDRDVVPLDAVAAAWERQDASPCRKLVIAIGHLG